MGQQETKEVKNLGYLDARQVANLLLGERWDLPERANTSGKRSTSENDVDYADLKRSPSALPIHVRKIWKKLVRRIFPTTASLEDNLYPSVLPCTLPLLFLLDTEQRGSFSGKCCVKLVKRIKEVLKQVHSEFKELQTQGEKGVPISADVEHLEVLLKVASYGFAPVDMLTLASIRYAVAQVELGLYKQNYKQDWCDESNYVSAGSTLHSSSSFKSLGFQIEHWNKRPKIDSKEAICLAVIMRVSEIIIQEYTCKFSSYLSSGHKARIEFCKWLWCFLTVRRSGDRLCLQPLSNETFTDDSIDTEVTDREHLEKESSFVSSGSWSFSSDVSDSFSVNDLFTNGFNTHCVQEHLYIDDIYLLLLFLAGDCVDFGSFMFSKEEEDWKSAKESLLSFASKSPRPLWEKWSGLWNQSSLLRIAEELIFHFGRSSVAHCLTENEFLEFAQHIAFVYLSRCERLESFGTFELRNCIGKGSFGIVKTARDLVTGKFVAIKKCIRISNTNENEEAEQELEAKILQELQGHPNVCRLINYFSSDQYSYIILEICGGGSLFETLSVLQEELCDSGQICLVEKGCKVKYKSSVGFTESQVRHWIKQLLSLLVYMHDRAVCHRDIRPSNLLLTNDGELRIGDFGSAARFSGGWDLFDGNNVVGSLYSIAPEQIERKAYFGTKIDIWCTGVLTYWLLTGQPPFSDDNVEVLYSNIKNMHFKLPEVSKKAKEFILSAMASDPDSRPDAHTLLCHPWLTGEESSIRTFLRFSQFEIPFREGLHQSIKHFVAFLKKVVVNIFSDVGIYCYEVGNGHSIEFLGDRKPLFCQACISSEYYLKFFTCFFCETRGNVTLGKICFELHRGRSILFLKVAHKLRDLILTAVK
ncbi:serine/threonine protein kinase isoform 1 [Galdieria sulphuraria]|uniref:non-specific serine/threonine protein kinase n=1 Tax=Galdieria sulphuraria TaxID=130081 RepID=M2Y8N7_GALSU|nr:serine/threonine protein kinase isoform 2 [Galdieria sulphuraria]XP_005708943.1 serine/threonine protein kinase isoform 1 [Galdieria sulphuraria]EME32422.1 serine/threonine protein kinase isoform 2 [Galdieria sulphuraria]EME32423.1 serine/threonine protein kinase isoform 1 [Galdieria sulphuraria]|eukprot:XP_005708942.1 serine/threonine protein kinase isoform 2 [Galdieria sulphuraria]